MFQVFRLLATLCLSGMLLALIVGLLSLIISTPSFGVSIAIAFLSAIVGAGAIIVGLLSLLWEV